MTDLLRDWRGWEKLTVGHNDLATTFPLHASRIIHPCPTTYTNEADVDVHVKCPKGHVRITPLTMFMRSYKVDQCETCDAEWGRLCGTTLAQRFPEIAAEADFDATKCGYAGQKIVKWKCPEGHRWTASVRTRTKGDQTGGRCPKCRPSSRGFDTSAAVAHVYILHDPYNHVVKVGVAGVDSRRLSGFANVGLETIAAFDVPGADAHSIEAAGLAAIREAGQPVPEAHFKRLYGSSIGGYTECVWDDSGASVTAAIDAISAAMGREFSPST